MYTTEPSPPELIPEPETPPETAPSDSTDPATKDQKGKNYSVFF